MSRLTTWLSVSVALVVVVCDVRRTVVSAAGAEILYSQSPPNGGPLLSSDFGNSTQIADDFQVAQNATIQEVRWWGFSGIPRDFTLRFFADVAGNPATTPFADFHLGAVPSTVYPTSPFTSDDLFDVVLPSGVPIAGGVKYYLSIVNNSGPNGEPWAWDTSGDAGPFVWFRSADGEAWHGDSFGGQAFELLGAVPIPEPGVGALALIDVAMLLGVSRRRAASRRKRNGTS